MSKAEVKEKIINDVIEKIEIALNLIDSHQLDIKKMKDYLGDMNATIQNCVPTCFNMFDFYKKDGTQWTSIELSEICKQNEYFI